MTDLIWGTLFHPILLLKLSATPLLATAAAVDESLVLAGVLLSLVAIYLSAKIGGEICSRINLPPVLGELLGGVAIGISALHLLIFPSVGSDGSDSLIVQLLQATAGLSPADAAAVFQSQSDVISILAELGVIVLLFEIGLQSNLRELVAVGTQAVVVATVGVAVPFAAGTAGLMVGFGIPAIPAIFAGAALTATSIGITSRVLSELGRLNSREGQIILGAAVIDDVLGIIVLAVVASLAKTGEIDVGNVIYLIVSASAFLLGSVLLGQDSQQKLFDHRQTRFKPEAELVIPAFTFAFVMAYIGTAIHLEAILGAFAAGLILDETDERKQLEQQVIPIADLVVPVFFVTVGARTNLGVLNPAIPSNREGLVMAVFLVVIAIVGKVVTGFTVFGQPNINRLAIGVGMIPRGEVGLVFLGVGSASGVLSPALEAAIVVMVIATTFLAPALLRVVFQSSLAPAVVLDAVPAAIDDPADSQTPK